MSENVKSWIADKVQAKTYKVHTLVGEARVVDDSIKLNMKTLRLDATLNNVKIHFQKGLSPILSKEVKLIFKNRILSFDLKKPTYKKRDLSGSKISVHNLNSNKNVMLKLNLHVLSEVDAEIEKILESYEIKIPVTFLGHTVATDIRLKIPLTEDSKGKKEKVKVEVDATLKKGILTIVNNVKIPVSSGIVHYANEKVSLHDIKVQDKSYAATISGNIKTLEKKVDLNVFCFSFEYGRYQRDFFFDEEQRVKVFA